MVQTKVDAVAEAITLAKKNGCQFVDLKFIDLPGMWQHYTLPIGELNKSLFEEGNGFDVFDQGFPSHPRE
jgi:glutamine synthetase